MEINRVGMSDTVLPLAKATVFGGQIRIQGLGTDASLYKGEMIEYAGDRRLLLCYDGDRLNPYKTIVLNYSDAHQLSNTESRA